MTRPQGRDNGLPPASRYSALVDVDPPVADHVLDLLRDADIPAVATPLTGTQGLARDTIPPDRPTERIHVDHSAVDRAHTVVGRALPSLRSEFLADAAMRSDAQDMQALSRQRELADADVDALFDDIVSGYSTTSTEPVPRWSVHEDVTPDDPSHAPATRNDAGSDRLMRELSGPRDYELIEDDGHFVPPTPPPLPETDPITRLAWGALLGGPLLILISTLLGLILEPWMVLGALAAFLGGFITLVVRMRDHKPEGWDDGAVV